MRVSVIHHGFDPPGGGERVCMSLLKALDKTGHDTDLRCVVPPPGVEFAGGSEGRPGGEGGALPAHLRLGRVRLTVVPRVHVGGELGGGVADFDAEERDLFRLTGSDVAVVTDGGFAMAKTDAPRVVWYCNSALRAEMRELSRPRPRHPRNILRMWRHKRPIRARIAAAGDKKVVAVPNSKSTMRAVSAAIGRAVEGPVVHPPVDVGRFEALRGMPKERRTATVARFSPEKNLGEAVRIMRAAGGRYDIVGNVKRRYQLDELEAVRRSASGQMRLHVDAGQDVLEDVVGGARAYLQTSEETFGVAVVEAMSAGCVPVVPDNSAHPETVPFSELRYGGEAEAAGIVRGALDGRYDGLLPDLREHARRFSEEAFQDAMLRIVEGGAGRGG